MYRYPIYRIGEKKAFVLICIHLLRSILDRLWLSRGGGPSPPFPPSSLPTHSPIPFTFQLGKGRRQWHLSTYKTNILWLSIQFLLFQTKFNITFTLIIKISDCSLSKPKERFINEGKILYFSSFLIQIAEIGKTKQIPKLFSFARPKFQNF